MPKSYPAENASLNGGGCVGDDVEASIAIEGHAEVDLGRIRRAVREILIAVGEDPDREGLVETPDRVARMYAEVFAGLHIDPAVHLHKLFTQEYDEMVLIKDITFASFCEHHLLPFTGRAHVAYLPKGRVVGLSKIPRLVDAFARRLQVQERLTVQIAQTLRSKLNAHGVGVVVEARHLCMMMRGVEKQNTIAVSSSMLGAFRSQPQTRQEFLKLIRR